ncbi:PepSY domain-containing protein [Nonomuraea sp. CA-141351]|uniref:PepSY domain-containing protein n=1 Tax=Nonomuraea sp. CA-141351 TaxID=3239996 RepID=UPI003D8D44DF
MRITKKFIIVGAGVVTLVAGGGVALATSATAAESVTASTATAATKVTRKQAIRIALKAVPGARVTKVEYYSRGARPDVWEVKLIKGSQRHELYVAVATGKIIHHEAKRVGRDDHGGRDDDRGGDRHGGRHGGDDD